jgi:hypothetical protein
VTEVCSEEDQECVRTGRLIGHTKRGNPLVTADKSLEDGLQLNGRPVYRFRYKHRYEGDHPPEVQAAVLSILEHIELDERTIFPKLEDDELPTEEELRAWNQDSQEAYFEQRKSHWNRVGGNDAANACRERGLWPGGTLPLMRDRLLRYDYCRSQLRPCETRTEEDNPSGPSGSDSDAEADDVDASGFDDTVFPEPLTEMPAVTAGTVEARIEPELQECLLDVIDKVCDYTGKNGDAESGRANPTLNGLAAFRGSGQHYRLPGTLKVDRRWEISGMGERRSGRRTVSTSSNGEIMSPAADEREPTLPEITEAKLPSEATLRSWNIDSQVAFWKQREAYWSRPFWTAAEMQGACRQRKIYPGLSPGCGYLHGPGKRFLKDRLIRYDFCRSSLTPAELRTDAEVAAMRRSNKKTGSGKQRNRSRAAASATGYSSDESDKEAEPADGHGEKENTEEAEESEISDSDDEDINNGWPTTISAFTVAAQASADGQRPSGFPTPLEGLPEDLPCGTKNLLVAGGVTGNQHMQGQQLPNMSKNMPSEEEFGTWNRESQEGLWRQRRAYYTNRLRLSEAQRECRLKNLWPGGDKPYVVDRLLRYECCKSLLTPADTQTHDSMTQAVQREFPEGASIRMLFTDGDQEDWYSGKVHRCVNMPAQRRAGATENFQLKLPHIDVRFPDGSIEKAVPLLVDDQINAELRVETQMDIICDAMEMVVKKVERQGRRDAREDRIQAKKNEKVQAALRVQDEKWTLVWKELQGMGWTRRTPSEGIEYFLPMAPPGGRPKQVKLGRDYFGSRKQVLGFIQGKPEHEATLDEPDHAKSAAAAAAAAGGRGGADTPNWTSTLHSCVAAIPKPRSPPAELAKAPIDLSKDMSPVSQAAAAAGQVAEGLLNWLYTEFAEGTRVRLVFANKNSEMVWYSGKVHRVKLSTTTGAGRKASKGRKYPHADVIFDDGSFERGVPLLTRVNQHTLPSPNPELRHETDFDLVCDAIDNLIKQVEQKVAPITSKMALRAIVPRSATQTRQCRECGGLGHFAKTCPLRLQVAAGKPAVPAAIGGPRYTAAEKKERKERAARPPPLHPPRPVRDPNSTCKACRGAHTKHSCGRQKTAETVAATTGATPQRQCRLCGGFGHFAKTCKLGAGEWKDRVHKRPPPPPVPPSDRVWPAQETQDLMEMVALKGDRAVRDAGLDYWGDVAKELGTQRSAFACQQYYLWTSGKDENMERVSPKFVHPDVHASMQKLCEKVEDIQFLCAKCGLPKATRRGWCQSRVCVQRRANLASGGIGPGQPMLQIDYEASLRSMKAQDHKSRRDPMAVWLGNDPLRPRAKLVDGKPVLFEPDPPPPRQETRGRPLGSTNKKRKLEQAGKVPPVQPALAPDAARAAVAAGATGVVEDGAGGYLLEPDGDATGAKKQRKVPGPQRGQKTAFNFWVAEVKEGIKAEHPGINATRGGLSALLGERWKALSVAERAPYEKMREDAAAVAQQAAAATAAAAAAAVATQVAVEWRPSDAPFIPSGATATHGMPVQLVVPPASTAPSPAAAAAPLGPASSSQLPGTGLGSSIGHLPPAPPPSAAPVGGDLSLAIGGNGSSSSSASGGASADLQQDKAPAAVVASSQQRALVYQQQQAALQTAEAATAEASAAAAAAGGTALPVVVPPPSQSPTIPSPLPGLDEDARFGAPVDETETSRRAEALQKERQKERQRELLAEQQQRERQRRRLEHEQQLAAQQAKAAKKKKGWAAGAASQLPAGVHKKYTNGKANDLDGPADPQPAVSSTTPATAPAAAATAVAAAPATAAAAAVSVKRKPGRPRKVVPPPGSEPVPAAPPTWAQPARDGARSSGRSVKQVSVYDPEAEASKPQW